LWTKGGLAWLNAVVLPSHSKWVLERSLLQLRHISAELKVCLSRIVKAASADKLMQRLMREPGIGIITALVMVAEIGSFTRFRTGKQLARFCGLSPRNVSSGEKQADAGIIKAGNPILRTAIVEAAHRIRRYNSRWNQLAAQLKSKGKPTGVVVVAVANRWIRALYHEIYRFEQGEVSA
jgi:transposase